MNRALVIGVIFIFVASSVIPISGLNLYRTSIVSSNSNIIYVDDDNIEGPWDGTIEHPYQYIQDGIDNSSSGDTVFVFNGTYYRKEIPQDFDSIVLVNKSINLVGENKTTTIIDGGEWDYIYYHVVNFMNANWSNISGFTIRNGGRNGHDVTVHSSHVNISHNIIASKSTKSSLYIWGNYNIIFGNNFSYIGVDSDGWHHIASDNTNFSNNILSNVYLFTGLPSVKSYTNYIYDNSFSDCWLGIWCDFGMDNSVICGNVFSNISSRPITISGLMGSKIINNKFLNNDGICIWLADSNDNLISYNIFQNNADCVWLLWGSNFNHIFHNNFINNTVNAHFCLYTLFNKWEGNYWNRSRLLPKPIVGNLGFFIPSWINIDWHPAKEPYDLGG